MKRLLVVLLAGAASLASAQAQSNDPRPVVVPLSSAFTLNGFGLSQNDNLFSEYVLHVARPGTGSPMRVSEWTPPQGDAASPGRPVLVSVEKPAASRRAPPVVARLPEAPLDQPAISDAAASAPSQNIVERWAARLPLPDLAPSGTKVVEALSGLGTRVIGLVPRVW